MLLAIYIQLSCKSLDNFRSFCFASKRHFLEELCIHTVYYAWSILFICSLFTVYTYILKGVCIWAEHTDFLHSFFIVIAVHLLWINSAIMAWDCNLNFICSEQELGQTLYPIGLQPSYTWLSAGNAKVSPPNSHEIFHLILSDSLTPGQNRLLHMPLKQNTYSVCNHI